MKEFKTVLDILRGKVSRTCLFPVSEEELEEKRASFRRSVREEYFQYFIYDHWERLVLHQSFSGTNKTLSIKLHSRFISGTIDDKIIKNRDAAGFVYTLNTGSLSEKPLYTSLPEVTDKLLKGDWVDTSGLLQKELVRWPA